MPSADLLPPHVRLVATDLDNTLLRSDRTVSPRTDAALRAAAAAGVAVVPVTARQRLGVLTVAPQFVELAEAFGGWVRWGSTWPAGSGSSRPP